MAYERDLTITITTEDGETLNNKGILKAHGELFQLSILDEVNNEVCFSSRKYYDYRDCVRDIKKRLGFTSLKMA